MDDLDGNDPEMIHQALRGDLELVAQYGEQHPEAWAGAWFDNEPAVRIVAAFADDPAPHDAALRPWLRYPDRLVVTRRQYPLTDLRRIREEIRHALGGGSLLSVGEGKGVVHVRLRADQEELAAELAARYGSAVELEVGFLAYPDPQSAPPRPRAGPEPREHTFDGLELSAEPSATVVQAGDDGHGQLVLRNRGTERIGPLFSGKPLTGSVLNASGEAVGGYAGAIAGVGLQVSLEPGQSTTIPFVYGTASTRADLGYVLPPGPYWLKVQVPYQLSIPGPATHVLTAPLTQITLVPRPSDP